MNKSVMVQNRVDLANEELKEGFKRPGRRLSIAVAALVLWGMSIIAMLTNKTSSEVEVYGYAAIALWPTLAVIFWGKYTNFEFWLWRD